MCFSKLFGDKPGPRLDTRKGEVERRLSPGMPMAGVGAELDGERFPTETEEELKRAADENDDRK
jgi:hypothetical protein